jgi:hypothetical protein
MVAMAWLSCEHLGRPWAEARRWVVIIAKLSCEHQRRKSTLSWQSDTNENLSIINLQCQATIPLHNSTMQCDSVWIPYSFIGLDYPSCRTRRPWTIRIAWDLGIELMPDSVATSAVVLTRRNGEEALTILRNGSHEPPIVLISNSYVIQCVCSYSTLAKPRCFSGGLRG